MSNQMLSPREMTNMEAIVTAQSVADMAADRLMRFTVHFGFMLATLMLIAIAYQHAARSGAS